jgi:hypothetical protein
VIGLGIQSVVMSKQFEQFLPLLKRKSFIFDYLDIVEVI